MQLAKPWLTRLDENSTTMSGMGLSVLASLFFFCPIQLATHILLADNMVEGWVEYLWTLPVAAQECRMG